jgi:hypothetical protein
MNFAEIKRWIDVGVQRGDLSNEYGNVVNEAIRFICNARTWTWMKKSAPLRWEPNEASVRLPGDFKELTNAQSAVTIAYDDTTSYPIQIIVYGKKELQRIYTAGFGRGLTARPVINYRNNIHASCYLDWNGNVATLNFPYRTLEPIDVNVDYYAYPEPLNNDDDTNFLLTEYPQMVLHKAKAMLFEAINDDGAAEISNVKYLEYYNQAANQDARKKIAGVTIRM